MNARSNCGSEPPTRLRQKPSPKLSMKAFQASLTRSGSARASDAVLNCRNNHSRSRGLSPCTSVSSIEYGISLNSETV